MTDITLSISTIASMVGSVTAVVGLIGGAYSYVQSLRDKSLADTLKLNFDHVIESLKRIDEYAAATRLVVDDHGRALSSHDKHIAVLENKVSR